MTIVIRVVLLGVIGVLLAVQFKGSKPEYGLYLSLVVSILIFAFSMVQVEALRQCFETIGRYLGEAGEYLNVLLKVIGITYICEFGAGICKDSGYGAIADQIEVLGKLSVLFAGLPILLAVIGQLQEFL